MGTLLRHGSVEQKGALPPQDRFWRASPAGLRRDRANQWNRHDANHYLRAARGDHYVVSGQKIWTSRAEHSDLLLLLVRTQKRDEAARPSKGLSVLLVDMRDVLGNGLTIRPIRTMLNHGTTELFFDEMSVPAGSLIGEEGRVLNTFLTA